MGGAKSGRRKDPSTTYEGTPCKRFGHTRRYKKSHACADCQDLDKNDPVKKQAAKDASARHRANPDNTIRVRYMKSRYGVTPEQFQAMEAAQGGLCAICGRPPRGRWPRLHLDHDHRVQAGKTSGPALLHVQRHAGTGAGRPRAAPKGGRVPAATSGGVMTYSWLERAFRHEGRCDICEAWTWSGVRRTGGIRYRHLCRTCAQNRFAGEIVSGLAPATGPR